MEPNLGLFYRSSSPKSMGLFSQIPAHNQMDIMKKLELREFIKFKRCSQETAELAKNFRHRLTLNARVLWIDKKDEPVIGVNSSSIYHSLERFQEDQIPLHVERFTCSKLTQEQFAQLEKICRNLRITLNTLTLTDDKNDPAMVDELIKLLNPHTLQTFACSSSYLSSLQEIKSLQRLHACQMTMNESGLLMFENPEIFVDSSYNPFVKSTAINDLLKQWAEKKRQIKELTVYHVSYYYTDIFNNLTFSVLWSQESPESGPFHHLSMKNRRRQIWNIYSLERADGVKIFVEISKNDGSLRLVAKEYQEIKEIEEWIHKIIQTC